MIKFPVILVMTLEENSHFDLWARLLLLQQVFGGQTGWTNSTSVNSTQLTNSNSVNRSS